MRSARVSRTRDGVAGAVAAAVALGVGELVAGLDVDGPSLVSAVGDEFIDGFAASLKDIAVSLFGTNDKVALVVGIVVTALVLGGGLGILSRTRPWVGPLGFAAFGVLGLLAFLVAPFASTGTGVLAAAAAATCGVVVLRLLLRLAGPPEAGPPEAGPDPDRSEASALPAMSQTAGAPRRAFLVSAGLLTVGALSAAALGRRIRGGDPTMAFRTDTALPPPAEAVPLPDPPPFSAPGLSPYITPTADFYRIDTALVAPRIDPGTWRLRVTGLVDHPYALSFDELLAMDPVEVPITMQCVSNEVGGDLVGTAVWQGVPLERILERAGVQPGGTQVVPRSVDGWAAGFPTALAGDGRTALLVYGMNGELLTPRHGFPARLVVAGLYGYVSATKWLSEIELTTIDDFDSYWVPRGWAKDGPIKLASRIDVPRGGAHLAPGPTAIAGVAWRPTIGIRSVEVQIDDRGWQPCELGDAAGDDTWVQWHHVWDATPGRHDLRVRAVDKNGEVQTAEQRRPDPDGATGHHTRRVTVG